MNYILVLMNIKTSTEEDVKDLNIQMLVVLDFIKSKFGFLTVPEIQEAFKMYVAKEFGHKQIFRTLDTILVSEVLNCFVTFRSDSLRSYNQKKQFIELSEKSKLSNSEIDKIMTNAINNKYAEFLEIGNISEPIVHIFDELIQRELIKTPNEKTTKYYDLKNKIASKQISRELKSVVCLDKKDLNAISKELEKIINSTSEKVKIRTKKLVLLDFFNSKKELGQNKII